MRVAVSTISGGLDDKVSEVFGRAVSFTIVDVEDGEIKSVEVVRNDFAVRGGGAGVAVSQFLVDKGVNAVITGNVGPNALGVLSSAGIKVYRGSGLTVKEAIEKLIRGELEEITSPSQPKMGRWRRGGGRGQW
ncbi:NifB/NifX family molybdenum-iron cluster-binding protein [Archaeoglobus profundus]|uniref:Dinitrogenase iron-molybdenum cofactor biosynthesis protein n=1 Tax=Archaeoglobus profundus (strain DSM 5631 / JCM 9629 / NBRC 100127 / Av18) TaxID=572546 RepID=D2RGT0_ARCPA|nr:NifB/NifX family molybdenum-iron cluster-binding protein [Archaeoglobus profundus]ADB57505.1 Dinitrogenase iron-molybdenum cofactor biosynthesis protein [Archaeoglobus profundus DSM 5631]